MSLRAHALVLFALALGSASPAVAATLTVNSVGDGPDNNPGNGSCWTGGVVWNGSTFVFECTLRAAIGEANALAGADTIAFAPYIALDGGGFVHITPGSALPNITDTLTIDGYTAPGYDTGDPEQEPIVRIDGNATLGSGLVVFSGGAGSTLRGLAVHGFSSRGIVLLGDDVVVQGCYVGLYNFGSVDGNLTDGIQVGTSADGVVIGRVCGPEPQGCTGRGNVVSGNGRHGIEVLGQLAVIAGNRIGTRADGNGTVAFGLLTGNGSWGIRAQRSGPQQTFVGDVGYGPGGVAVPAGNLVSGNGAGGILIDSDLNTVRANLVGTRLDGTGDAGNQSLGIHVIGADNVIGDVSGDTQNVVGWNEGDGIVIGEFDGLGSDRNLVIHNRVGTDAAGLLALPNDVAGVALREGSANRIETNLVSGNQGTGIWGVASGTEVVGNRVGVTPGGACLGNGTSGGSGIRVAGDDWQIGTPMAGEGNVVGCNQREGIEIESGATGSRIQANHVGTDTLGNDLGNGLSGIRIEVAGGNLVGGSLLAGEGNVVGFNSTAGIRVRNADLANEIYGNLVGTNANDDPLGNMDAGIQILLSSNQVVGDPLDPDRRNVVAHNGGSGVFLDEALMHPARNNTIRRNAIHDNAGLGIDLDPPGPNGNDPGDLDIGPNQLQNAPVLDPALAVYDPVGDQVTLRYQVDSDPNHAAYDLAVDFYVADASGEGKTWVGEALYTAPGSSPVVSFTPAPGASLVGASLVATATDGNGSGNTSEFSAPVLLPEPGVATGLAAGLLLLRGLAARSPTRRRALPG